MYQHRHYWQYAGSMSRAQCRLCGLQVERIAVDEPWKLWRVALSSAIREIRRGM